MSIVSKRLVSTVAGTLVLSLVSASANAEGTWYRNYNDWRSLVTNVQTAEYGSPPSDLSAPWIESDITATTGSVDWAQIQVGVLSTFDVAPVTFTFAGNAFGGYFAVDGPGENLTFSVNDGSLAESLSVKPYETSYTFLGYISNSSSNINVTVTPSSSYIMVDSFSRANGTNTSNPGSNVAPEPGSFALALTGGAALIGICVRRRRNAG